MFNNMFMHSLGLVRRDAGLVQPALPVDRVQHRRLVREELAQRLHPVLGDDRLPAVLLDVGAEEDLEPVAALARQLLLQVGEEGGALQMNLGDQIGSTKGIGRSDWINRHLMRSIWIIIRSTVPKPSNR